MRLLLSVALIFCLSGGAARAAGQERMSAEVRRAVEEIDALASAEQAARGVGSLSIGIVRGPELLWTKSYGYADTEKKQAASKETLYRIGSVTTQFTALMLLQLVQAGKVRLSDPVEKYLPEVSRIQGRYPEAPPITLFQLATHTSGLASEPANAATFTSGSVSDWEKTLLAALPQTKYVYEPGTRVSYSNIGYAILGAALGRAAGRSYVEYVSKQIFAPLGMTRTAFEPPAQGEGSVSTGYETGSGKVDADTPRNEHRGRGYKVPNGGAYTSIEDLARYVSFELGAGPEEVLRKETFRDTLQRYLVLTNDNAAFLASGYGIGFRYRLQEGGFAVYGHAGGVAGYEARADFDPVSRFGVIVLRNAGGKDVHVATTKLVVQAFEKLAPLGRVAGR